MMKKLYAFIFLVFAGTTAFMTADDKKEVNASVVVEDAEVVVLNSEEKNKLFKEHAKDVYSQIQGKKPSLEAFTQALKVHHSLKEEGKLEKPELLTIIDFSLASTKKRLWVFNLNDKSIIENIVVSHGRNSGLNEVKSFSNVENSYQSSMGAFLTAETYTGKHGLSLRLDGLEEGINNNARNRAIVMHTAAYANPSLIKVQGRLGRSLGCPAIPLNKIDLITNLSGGSLIFVYGKDNEYKDKTAFKNIDTAYNSFKEEMKI